MAALHHGANRLDGSTRATQFLTSAAITEATGASEHGQLEEIELIFGTFEEIEPLALRQCWNLQRLTLINCRLARIAGLDCVGATLLHLSLSDQQITHIDGLAALVNLRILCLQQNRIERIEGLDNCRRLQKLWLYGNRIERLENLAACSDLRELWLQDNALESLDSDGTGVSTLANLTSLHHLRTLVSLRDLSFADEHFGSNPIAAHPAYRSLAVTTLEQLQRLDGVAIGRSERDGATDQFLAQALAFSDTLTDLTNAYEVELRNIAGRRDRGRSDAQMLQRELVEALNELERCVHDGQQQIRSERARQQRVRDDNTQQLTANVAELQQRFHAQISRQAAQEERALRREELELEALEQAAVAEYQLTRSLAMLEAAAQGRVALQQLPEHSPDARYIASHFGSSTSVNRSDDSEDVQLLQLYRVFNCDLTARFDAATADFSISADTGIELYLYVVASECELLQWLQYGLGSTSTSSDTSTDDDRLAPWLFLFSDPLQALAFYCGTSGSALLPEELLVRDTVASTTEPTEAVPRIASFQLLLCRVHMAQTVELFDAALRRDLTSLDALLGVATPQNAVLPPPPNAFVQIELGDSTSRRSSSSSSHVYVARRAHIDDVVLPLFLVLCSKRLPVVDSVDDISSSHADTTVDTEIEVADTKIADAKINDDAAHCSASSILVAFERALDSEVAAFHARLVAEVDSAHERFRSQLLDETKQLDERLRQQRTQIEHEKKVQEQLVRAIYADPRGGAARRG